MSDRLAMYCRVVPRSLNVPYLVGTRTTSVQSLAFRLSLIDCNL